MRIEFILQIQIIRRGNAVQKTKNTLTIPYNTYVYIEEGSPA